MIIFLLTATVLVIIWLLLLNRATYDDYAKAAYCKVLDNYNLIDKITAKGKERYESFTIYSGVLPVSAKLINRIYIISVKAAERKVQTLKNKNEELQNGELKSVNMFVLPGYVLLREIPTIYKTQIYTLILRKCIELYGKKHSTQKARHIIAQIISYSIICIAVSLLIGVLIMAFGGFLHGLAGMGLGILLSLAIIYAIYDELDDSIKKRRKNISKQFPGVVSKLALLVTSGMIMDRAWKLTAHSDDREIYREMKHTSNEIDNLVNSAVAYSNFINRCNTKETAKLAGAIMQNLTKGNAEIGKLLREMAREAWLERRHKAKRDAERANSLLMIPTMMLFLAVLIMLMVPIVLSFSGL